LGERVAIRRLTDETVGKIAAGEVIERPAAAIKELIENALDARATRIDVAISGGGIDVLEVRDDGTGIPFEDLPLSVERHATSKIQALDDLNHLSTLGFRGEALASLAAVSDLCIRTLAHGEAAGGALDVAFGEVRPVRHIAWGSGTSILARDLFANVPARRKFLRQVGTESGYVARVVSAYALAYPEIAFTLEIDGRRSFATSGSGDPVDATVAVWGPDVAGMMLPIEIPDDAPSGFVVTGIVSHPSVDRATRQQQFLFAQGRLITSRQIGTAFEQAYHTLLMVGRRPLGCICVRVPSDRIDVNVHPTKAEVRFADERLVFALVQRAVREALVGVSGPQPVPTLVTSPLIDQTVQRRLALAHPERRSDPSSWQAWNQPQPATDEQPRPVLTNGSRLPVLRVLGQVANMFVVAEGPDGLYLIDQHAAHERILYEQLMEAYASRLPDMQMLLSPVIVELGPAEWSMYLSAREELTGLGFATEEFGTSTVAIRGVPAILKVRDPAHALQTILNELIGGGRGQTRLESLAISAACHGSIRAGQALSLLEMRELTTQLERCSSPLACGHGRPTMLRMTAEELANQFARR
jgi:DNA mismatch repair protein MutL